MKSLLNPWIFSKVLKSYIFDINRIKKYDRRKLERYRDKIFLKILRRAISIPLYREKYRDIDLKNIKGIKDIEKLPIITKEDLRNAFPDKLLPDGENRIKYSVISTSGSTGKPVSLFVDPMFMYRTLIYYVRILKEYGINWRKDRLALIIDLSPGSGEERFFNGIAIPNVAKIFSLNNIRTYHIGDDPKRIIEDMDRFKPTLIGGYPDILKILAILKNSGYGRDINPKYIASSGAILDRHSRKDIEDAFDARVFESYGATECSPMAFECINGNFHIQTDVVHMEFINKDGESASPGEVSEIVITSLIEGGTPIIRYSGVSDLLVPSDRECDCGMDTPIIERIEGRKIDSIVLPDGRLIPPLSITGIPYHVMMHLNLMIIEQFQIVQRDYSDIEVHVVFKNSTEKEKEKVSRSLKDEFSRVLGDDISITIKEVDEIKTNRRSGIATPPPVVISKVRKD